MPDKGFVCVVTEAGTMLNRGRFISDGLLHICEEMKEYFYEIRSNMINCSKIRTFKQTTQESIDTALGRATPANLFSLITSAKPLDASNGTKELKETAPHIFLYDP